MALGEERRVSEAWRRGARFVNVVACLTLLHPAGLFMAQGTGAAEAGRRSFESRCAGCHGLDGRGGERAPDIARNAKVRAHTDAELRKIIHDGVPGTGMPGFRMLDERSTQ